MPTSKQSIGEITSQLISFPTLPTAQDITIQAFNYIQSLLPSHPTRIISHQGFHSLWITNNNYSNPDVLLLCHLDVVQGQPSEFDPITTQDKITGRGAFDMKGNLAAMISVIQDQSLSSHNLQLLITSDEEIGGTNGAGWFFSKQTITPKVAVVPDGTDIHNIVVKQKGPLHLVIESKGLSAHASRPWVGQNPVDNLLLLANKLQSLKQADSNSQWLPTYTITNLEAQTSINQIANHATLTLDLRLTDPSQLAQVHKLIDSSHCKVINQFGDGQIFHQEISPIHQTWINSASGLLNNPIQATMLTGSSDARHLPASTQTIITSSIGANAHGSNEWVKISSLQTLSLLTKKFIKSI